MSYLGPIILVIVVLAACVLCALLIAAIIKARKSDPRPAASGQIPQNLENPKMNASILVQLFSAIPQLVQAVQTIMNSDAAHTIESAVKQLIQHNTPGQPNAKPLNG